MRAVIVAFVGGVVLAGMSAQAAPLPPKSSPIELRAGPPVELVAGGCGWGWHRTHWRDHWGYWHWGQCVPYGGPHGGWGAGWNHHYSYWRGPSGGWGNP
jgi:hypothetical protein